MKTKHSFLLITFLFFLLFDISMGFCQSPEDLIQTGDRHFNQGDYKVAFDLYRQVYDQLENVRPIPPLLTEVINNMGAVYIAKDDYSKFFRYFSAARKLKQGFVGRTVERSKDNLLVNGGFEQGLIFPWGTGHYERSDGKFRNGAWWNSKNARAFMKIDADVIYSGKRSLQITNYSPTAPHVFTTLSQRIAPLEPNTTYKISCFVKAENLKPRAVGFTIDAAWTKRPRALPGGTYNWQAYSDTINIGHNNYIDFRILHLDTGTIWLDDIVIEKVEAFGKEEQFQRAQRLFEQADYAKALDIFLKLEKKHRNNRGKLRQVELYSGRIYLILGQYQEALERFTRVIESGNARAVIDLSDLYYSLGDYDKAEAHFKKSYKIAAGDQGTESLVLNKLSRCYLAQGKSDQALKAQKRSLFILRHIEDKHGQAQSLNQLGIIYQHKAMVEKSVGPFLKALNMAEALGDKKLASDIRFNLAETSRLRKRWDESDKYAIRALKIKEEIGDQLGMVKVLHLQGRLCVAGGDLKNGEKRYQQAIHRFEALVSDAADISRETKATFIKGFSQLYREYTALLLRLYEDTRDAAYHREAFQVTEQARSRIFTEMISEAAALHAFASTSQDPEFVTLLKTERLLNARIHGLEKQIRRIRKKSAIKELNRQLQETRQNRRKIRGRLVKDYPRYADLKKPKPLGIEDVQKLLRTDEIVLSYFITPGRTGLWTITRENASFAVIPLSRETLISQTETFRRALSEIPDVLSRSDPANGKKQVRLAFSCYDPDTAHALYKILVAPAEPLLKTKPQVYLALNDLLYKLPFETLLTRPFVKIAKIDKTVKNYSAESGIGAELRNAPFWVKTHNIAYLPSLSVLRSLRKLGKDNVKERSPLLAFADPAFESSAGSHASDGGPATTRSALLSRLQTRSVFSGTTLPPLPDTRKEALAVAKILGASPEKAIYLRDRASEYNLKHLPLTRYQYLLFATHGFMAGEFGPGIQPALALSFINDPENDGLLEMGEILGLDLNADMVVLSACNTASGGGEKDHGEGFAGLTRSFMYAGGRSLLVTQWSVESSSAKTLVQNTFRKAKNRTIGNALALSKRAMIKFGVPIRISSEISVSTSHPFFWAPYILVGEGN